MRPGLIGLGLMGLPIAQRILKAGYELQVWNRSAERTLTLTSTQVTVALTPADLAKNCDTILLCLSDETAVRQIVAILEPHLGAQHTVVDLSTISARTTCELAMLLKNNRGAEWIDCPMSGGVVGAEQGRLILMAGGMAERMDAIRPLLASFSQRISLMGPVGSGQMTKLCNQLIVASNSLLIAEAVRLAETHGVDAAQLATSLAGGFADSLPLQILTPRMAARQHEPVQWRVSTLHKDLRTALEAATEQGLELPVAQQALEQLTEALARWPQEDLSHIIGLYEHAPSCR